MMIVIKQTKATTMKTDATIMIMKTKATIMTTKTTMMMIMKTTTTTTMMMRVAVVPLQVWDDKLAKVAAKWARRCSTAHDRPKDRAEPGK